MYTLWETEGYAPLLSLKDTQRAIKLTKDLFQVELAAALELDRVTAPIIVTAASGINDDLNGVERKVSFDMKEMDGEVEVVQSLAKWKRMALHRYGYTAGAGIYTDMNAIRRDDSCDNIHSVYVDQWDWEKVITESERTVKYLKDTVRSIVRVVADVKDALKKRYPVLTGSIDREVYFITAEELRERYPDLSPKERENRIISEHATVFLMQIGGKLSDGTQHDGRAPDYDDWTLNGDLLFRNDILGGSALEISSMGIRVDGECLKRQLAERNASERMRFPYHRMVADGTLPLTVGGGIGQSRLCMLILEKAHIGEVQCSVWPEKMREECLSKNIELL